MISRDSGALVTGTPAPHASPLVVELQQTLWSWTGHCDEAAAALAGDDLEAADRSLLAREALRPRIQELVGTLRRSGAAAEALGAISRLQQSAAAAEERLISVLEGEQFRLRREIDGIGRTSASAAAYGRAHGVSPHRLDIVR